jgi:two-component system, NtrC family, response regulator AtoC
MPLSLQAKILRALEERTFERVGGTTPLHVDVRVVAATNRNLKAAVAARQYREDLYFRLSVFPIVIPPLCDRPEDIPTLARFFIDRFCRDLGKRSLVLSPAAETDLRNYGWPGNVRELQNCIERAAILTEGDTIHPRHLNLSFRGPAPVPVEDGGPWSKIDLSGTLTEATRRTVAEVERRKIEQALKDAGGNRGRAAEVLQVSFKTFTAKLKDYGLE